MSKKWNLWQNQLVSNTKSTQAQSKTSYPVHTALPKTNPVVYAPKCSHCEDIAIGEHTVTLVGINEPIPSDLDVFIDMTGFRKARNIPQKYKKYLTTKTDLIIWEVTDGKIDSELPNFVFNLLKDGFKVGFGCHGAHGRTGWLAAKLHKMITGSSGDEAVRYIREEFCEKAVETLLQTTDLGCVKEEGSYTIKTTTVGFGTVWDHLNY